MPCVCPGAVGPPLKWNLAPGEPGLVVLPIGCAVGYEGTLTVGVVDAGHTTDMEVVVAGVEPLSAPALVQLDQVRRRHCGQRRLTKSVIIPRPVWAE